MRNPLSKIAMAAAIQICLFLSLASASTWSQIKAASTDIASLPFATTGILTTGSPVYVEEPAYEDDDAINRYVGVYKITLGDETVAISLGSDIELDTYLYVLDEAGELVNHNDDVSERPFYVNDDMYLVNSSLKLSGPGTYYILASTYSSTDVFDGLYEEGVTYAIEVKTATSIASLNAASTEITSLPFTASGALTAASSLEYEDIFGNNKYVGVYKITLDGGPVGVSLSGAEDFDAFLYVLDEDGDLVTYNDDIDYGIYNSYLEFYGYGTYYILAASAFDLTEGTYEIKVESAGLADKFDVASTSITNLPFTHSGELTEDSFVYSFEYCDEEEGYCDTESKYAGVYKISFNGTVAISLTSDDEDTYVDTYLYVFDAAGNLVAANDDCEEGEDTNSCLEFSGDGVYYILASTYENIYGEGATGAYKIDVTLVEGALPIISAVVPKAASSLKAWAQSGTLYMSGLTAGKTYGIYTAKGALVQSGIASGAEMNINLNMSNGVYFVKSNGQTQRITNK